jgi:hypothetical protein
MPHTGSSVLPRLALLLLVAYSVLVLIVLVNPLIAIVSDSYKEVKRNAEVQVSWCRCPSWQLPQGCYSIR